MESYTEEQQRIIRLVEKLNRLAEGTHSNEEAEAALLKAQALLHEYNLTINDLSFYEKETECSQHGIILASADFPGWLQTLTSALADIYDCYTIVETVRDGTRRRKVVYIGVEPNVSILEHSFLLCYRHTMLCPFPKGTTQKSKTEYRNGFAIGIYAKLLREKLKNDKQTPGLVPITKNMASKAANEAYPNASDMRKPKQCGVTASYMQGVQDGNKFNIAAGVKDTTPHTMAIK